MHQCVNKSPLAISVTAWPSMQVHLLISWQTSCTVNGGLIEQERSRNNPAEDCWIFSINSWKVPETDSRFFQSSLTFKSQSHLITSKSSLQLNTHTYTVQASPTTSMTLPQSELMAISFPSLQCHQETHGAGPRIGIRRNSWRASRNLKDWDKTQQMPSANPGKIHCDLLVWSNTVVDMIIMIITICLLEKSINHRNIHN